MDEISRNKQAVEIFQDLLRLTNLLIKDVTDAANNIDPKNPSRQRNYVRTVFAMIEGALNAMCRTIMEVKEMNEWSLSEKEIKVLSDSTIFFKQGPNVIDKRRSFAPLMDRIKVAFKVSRKMLNDDCGMDFEGRDWCSFRKALEIRHRLSHPKQSSDLEISNGDIALTDAARDWFRFGVQRFFQTITSYLRHKFKLERGI